MRDQPSGTVTFLFTDIEGSTRLWERHPAAMASALARHDALLRATVAGHGGCVFKTVGDAFCAAFHTASAGLAAAADVQRALRDEPWPADVPIRVRMGLHTGAAELRDDDYFGPPLNRVARLMSAGHGGQVLLSQATQELVRDGLPPGVALRDMGERRLKDLIRPEHVYQLVAPGLDDHFPPLKTLDARAHNLPVQSTSFVGREREIRDVERALASGRLVTLTGAGGAGKTRLALQVAAELVDEYADGVWLVELAAVADPRIVPQVAARALGVSDPGGASVDEALAVSLREKELLVVLDNCEHLIAACAALADLLVAAGPAVRVLATSREALRIPAEFLYRVPSLSAPEPGKPARLAALTQYEAVRLFIDRALATAPGFLVDNANAPALASICHRLDGIPLAIELAAARTRSLALQEIDARLEHRFALLTGGSRTAVARQQTLRALIDWSYELLSAPERALLARCSVFAGSFDLAAAEDVGAGDGIDVPQVCDLVASLVDKSLVLAEPHGETMRYGMLETIREYASDRLRERGEGKDCASRHLAHFLSLAESYAPRLDGPEAPSLLDRLETENRNFGAALAHAALGDAAAGLRLATALFLYWGVRGYVREGREWLARMLDARPAGASAGAAAALRALASLAWRQSDLAAAHAAYAQQLAMHRELDDRGGAAGALVDLGGVACEQGRLADARAYLEEALELQRALDNRQGIAGALSKLGSVALALGEHDIAQARHEEALALWRPTGNARLVGMTLGNLGLVALSRGDTVTARGHFEATLPLFRELGERQGEAITLQNLGSLACAEGDYATGVPQLEAALVVFRQISDRFGLAGTLDALASAAGARGDVLRAARLWGGAAQLHAALGIASVSDDASNRERAQVAARGRAANAMAFDQALEEGRTMALEALLDDAIVGRVAPE
jgi:predicted ATPase/class 3 adenylate cyclase